MDLKGILKWGAIGLGAIAAAVVAFFIKAHFDEFDKRGIRIAQLSVDIASFEAANKAWVEYSKKLEIDRAQLQRELEKYGVTSNRNEQTIADLNKKIKSIPKPVPALVPLGETPEIRAYREELNQVTAKQQECLNKALQGATDVSAC